MILKVKRLALTENEVGRTILKPDEIFNGTNTKFKSIYSLSLFPKFIILKENNFKAN